MNLLVTGGAGFIGVNFIDYMLRTHPDYRIVCLDLLTYAANPERVSELEKNDNFRFVKGDIRDREAVYSLFKEESFDAVINFAAESHVDRSIENPDVFLSTNVLGTGVLLDACLKYGKIRFHQISTDEVYGDLPFESTDSFSEKDKLSPSSPYSASKASADMLVLSYGRTFGLPVTISRSSNNYGPYQHSEKLIPTVISKALSDEKIPVYGDGRNLRDWLHAEDHCKAIDLILHKGTIGEIYNVASEKEYSNIDTVRAILSLLGKGEELISFVSDRPGHDLRYAVDCSKIRAQLGWSAETEFTDGLRDTVRFYERKYGGTE